MAQLAPIIEAYKQLNNMPKLEAALTRLTQVNPASAEAWYDLGTVRLSLQKKPEAIVAISNALALNKAQRATNPSLGNLAETAQSDGNFAALRGTPEFQKLFGP